jgi:multiple antibiotic resistance protein
MDSAKSLIFVFQVMSPLSDNSNMVERFQNAYICTRPESNMLAYITVIFLKQNLFSYFLQCFTSLFSVINPLGMMPVFLALTAAHDILYRNQMARKACIYMVLILAFFLFAGTYIMSFFGFSLISLRIAGGLVVMRSGFLLLNGNDKSGNLSSQGKRESIEKADISLTPLAMPLLSGPGSIATTVSLATHNNGFTDILYILMILLAIVIIGILSYIILRVSQKLLPIVSRAGLEAITRIMGFIAMTVGVQFIINGVGQLLVYYKAM